jgi:lipopolysaccharide export system protein LptA
MKILCTLAMIAMCGLAVRAQTNSATATNAAPRETVITSDSGDFAWGAGAHQAVYKGHVRVDDPQMKLTCEWLVADLPESGPIHHIVAETNVVIDFTDDRDQPNHATCDKAVYDFEAKSGVTNEIVTLTGHAQVENPQAWITGEPIKLDLLNRTMHADNQKVILRQTLENSAAETNGPPANTNPPAATPRPPAETKPPPATNVLPEAGK